MIMIMIMIMIGKHPVMRRFRQRVDKCLRVMRVNSCLHVG